MEVIWYYAARYLGKGAIQQDVEDAVVDLYTVIDQVRMSYRPESGPNFIKYLLNVCFRHNCVREGNRLRKRIAHETPLEVELDDRVVTLHIVDEDVDNDPGRRAENRAFSETIVEFLNTSRMPDGQREAFILRFIHGLPYEEIAEKIGAPVGSVKGWLSRSTAAARKYLDERGWS